jgi:hypothetical protein
MTTSRPARREHGAVTAGGAERGLPRRVDGSAGKSVFTSTLVGCLALARGVHLDSSRFRKGKMMARSLIYPLPTCNPPNVSCLAVSAIDYISSVARKVSLGDAMGGVIDTGHRTQDTGHRTQDTGAQSVLTVSGCGQRNPGGLKARSAFNLKLLDAGWPGSMLTAVVHVLRAAVCPASTFRIGPKRRLSPRGSRHRSL